MIGFVHENMSSDEPVDGVGFVAVFENQNGLIWMKISAWFRQKLDFSLRMAYLR